MQVGWPLPPCVEVGRTAGWGGQGRAGRPPRVGSCLSGHTSGWRVPFSVPVPSPARQGYRQWLWAAGVLGCPALAVAPSLPLPSQRPGVVGCSTEAGVPGPIRPQAVVRRAVGTVLTRVHTLTRRTPRSTQAALGRASPSAPGLQVAASWGSCSKQTPSGAGTERFCSRTRVGSWNQEPSRPRVTGAFLQWGRGGANSGPVQLPLRSSGLSTGRGL